jgi:exopolysaccharide production protein ExoZ
MLFFLCCILLNYALGNHYPLLVFFGNGIMLEFLLGVCCGLLFLSGTRLSAFQANALIMAGIVGLMASLLLGYGVISKWGYTVLGTLSLARSAVWGIPAALLVAGIAMKEKTRPLRVHPFWIAIGNASFSIYLLHILIMGSLYVRWEKWGVQTKLQPDLLMFITMGAVLALGYVFYLLVEKPLLRKLKAFTKGWTALAGPQKTRE